MEQVLNAVFATPCRREFRVTNWHIENGEPSQCHACPVALAILGELVYGVVVLVDLEKILIASNEYSWCINAPCNVKQFICDYDNGQEVNEFSFELDVTGLPDEIWRDAK